MPTSQSLFSQPHSQIPPSARAKAAALASLNTESRQWRQLSALVGSEHLRRLLEHRDTAQASISSSHSFASIEANGWAEFDEAVELVDDPQGGSRFQIRLNDQERALPDMIVFGGQADGDRFTIWSGGHTVTLHWDELLKFLELWRSGKENRIRVGGAVSSGYANIGLRQSLKVIWRYAKLG